MNAKKVRKLLNRQCKEKFGTPSKYFSLKRFLRKSWKLRKRKGYLRTNFGKVVETKKEWRKSVTSALNKISSGEIPWIRISIFKFEKSRFKREDNRAIDIWVDYGTIIEDAKQ